MGRYLYENCERPLTIEAIPFPARPLARYWIGFRSVARSASLIVFLLVGVVAHHARSCAKVARYGPPDLGCEKSQKIVRGLVLTGFLQLALLVPGRIPLGCGVPPPGTKCRGW